jgi:hypothetical protein
MVQLACFVKIAAHGFIHVMLNWPVLPFAVLLSLLLESSPALSMLFRTHWDQLLFLFPDFFSRANKNFVLTVLFCATVTSFVLKLETAGFLPLLL